MFAKSQFIEQNRPTPTDFKNLSGLFFVYYGMFFTAGASPRPTAFNEISFVGEGLAPPA